MEKNMPKTYMMQQRHCQHNTSFLTKAGMLGNVELIVSLKKLSLSLINRF